MRKETVLTQFGTVKSYRDLVAWQKARMLVKEVYLLMAIELETQLVLAVDLGLCDDARSRPVVGFLQEVIRVLQGLIVALERRIEG